MTMAAWHIDRDDERVSAMQRLHGALNGASVAACLHEAGYADLLGPGEVRAWKTRRVHFGSKLGIVIDYDVDIERSGRITTQRAFAQIPWQHAHATYIRAREKLAAQARLSTAASTTTDGDNQGNGHAIAFLKPLGLIVRAAGADERVPGLRLLHDFDYCRSQLRDPLIEANACTAKADPGRPVLIAHRLGKRSVLRLPCGDEQANPSALIIKLYKRASGMAARSHAHHAALASAFEPNDSPVSVPRALINIPGLEALVMRQAPGEPLTAFDGAARRDVMAHAGEALARLHAARLEDIEDYGVDDEIALLARWVDFVTAHAPDDGIRFSRALRSVIQLLEATDPFASRLIHRDFHERQVIATRNSATLIDFDTVRLGDPAQDIGNFLAHLEFAELVSGTPAGPAADAFVAAYEHCATSTDLSRRNVNAHVRATLLRLALINYFSQHTDHHVGALLAKVEAS